MRTEKIGKQAGFVYPKQLEILLIFIQKMGAWIKSENNI